MGHKYKVPQGGTAHKDFVVGYRYEAPQENWRQPTKSRLTRRNLDKVEEYPTFVKSKSTAMLLSANYSLILALAKITELNSACLRLGT